MHALSHCYYYCYRNYYVVVDGSLKIEDETPKLLVRICGWKAEQS